MFVNLAACFFFSFGTVSFLLPSQRRRKEMVQNIIHKFKRKRRKQSFRLFLEFSVQKLQLKNYLFENWNLFLALFLPYFLRSLTRGSRVNKPSKRNTFLYSSLALTKALEIPCLIAPH